MGNRRIAERLLIPTEDLEYITLDADPGSAESDETEEQTQPMRLSFLALLAEKDPAVQTRLNLRRKLALEAERLEAEDNRPTDPMTTTLSRKERE
ncbi:MAG: hypothetical protein ACREDF_10935 [Thermoplasmata archaeon]